MSAAFPVCILAAGRGGRMGRYGTYLHKALLPLAGRAIISHIVENFSMDTEFVVAVGHRAAQLKAYLSLAHPNLNVTYVSVDNYQGPASGPGHSLLCCESVLQRPFFFVTCDTVWKSHEALPTGYDWFGAAVIDPSVSASYCNLELAGDDRIVAVRDKEHVQGKRYAAWIGLCFVRQYEFFWQGLRSPSLIGGEHQISSGTRALVAAGAAKAHRVDWIDTGDVSRYENALRRFGESPDTYAQEHVLYQVGGRTIEYYAAASCAASAHQAAKQRPEAFLDISEEAAGFFSYTIK